MDWVCKGCTEREVGCHSKCARYQEQKKNVDAIKKEQADEKRVLDGIFEWRLRKYEQARKRNKRG